MELLTARQYAALSATTINAEITNVSAVLAARYAPNSTFADLCDSVAILGKTETRVPWSQIVSYLALLNAALAIQATEVNGIGILDAKFHGNSGDRGLSNGGW